MSTENQNFHHSFLGLSPSSYLPPPKKKEKMKQKRKKNKDHQWHTLTTCPAYFSPWKDSSRLLGQSITMKPCPWASPAPVNTPTESVVSMDESHGSHLVCWSYHVLKYCPVTQGDGMAFDLHWECECTITSFKSPQVYSTRAALYLRICISNFKMCIMLDMVVHTCNAKSVGGGENIMTSRATWTI